jgi:hypothetical protein
MTITEKGVPLYVIKAYAVEEVWLDLFLNFALDGAEWPALGLRSFSPGERFPGAI